MQLKLRQYLFFILVTAIVGCRETESPQTSTVVGLNSEIHYAKRFSIVENKQVVIVSLFGNRAGFDTTNWYVLAKDTNGLQSRFAKAMVIKTPCQKIAALSSIYAAMLCELGVINNIIAIDNIDYVNNASIINKYQENKIKELQKTPNLDLEQTIGLRPDVVFTFGMGYDGEQNNAKLKQLNIPLAVSVDHLEQTPLARAEWIKFFAAFVDKRKEADSIFAGVEKNYHTISTLARHARARPTVFSETKYGDVWYMPGGKSYMASMLENAGAAYLWSDNKDFGSLPLSFEQVYSKAKDADYWLNLPLIKSKKELIAFEKRYKEFAAFKNDKIFNNTKVHNEKGYSSYWETGMMFPDRVLSDLVQIFHPELTEKINRTFYYYEQMK